MSVTVPRVSNTLRSQVILSNVNATAAELLIMQGKLSSGRSILSPSDAPADASVASQLMGYIEQKARFTQNIQTATGVLSAADAALGEASTLITRAHTLGLEEIGSTSTEQTRASAATVITEIINEMVSIGNTRFAGRFIFAGRDTLEAPFEEVAGGIYFGGDTGTVDVTIDYMSTSSTSVDAASAFGAVSSEVKGTRDLDPLITVDTLLSDLNRGAGVAPGSILIDDGTTTSLVDLSGARTIGDVMAAIDAGTPATTTVSMNAAGNGLSISTAIAGGQMTITNVLGGSTATDLGIFQPAPAGPLVVGQDVDARLTALTPTAAIAGVDWASGLVITNGGTTKTIDLSGAEGIQDVLNRINGAGLYVEARINEDATGIDVVSRLSGTEFSVGENGGTTATDLGIRSMTRDTALEDLNGGRGITTVDGDDVTITLRDGTSFSVDLSSATTVGDAIDAINAAPGNPGTLTASLAATGNGILLADSTGGAGSLTVGKANLSNAAAGLGIEASVAGDTISGEDVNPIRADGVMTHLLGLREALLANDQEGVSYYTDLLEGDNNLVLERRASVGSRQQRMDIVRERVENEVLELKGLLSERIDLDYASSIVRLSTLQASFEAGLKTAGSFLQMSLINFLG